MPEPAAAFCHRCNRDTPTILLPLSSGHIGRVCSVCRSCRRGQPYASSHEYQQFLADAHRGRGLHHEFEASST